jgi:hypothetical protein
MFIPFSNSVTHVSLNDGENEECFLPETSTSVNIICDPNNAGNALVCFEDPVDITTCIKLYPGMILECAVVDVPNKRVFIQGEGAIDVQVVPGIWA